MAVTKWIQRKKNLLSVEALPGDASTRQYFRIKTENQNFIVMVTEPFTKETKTFPFLVLQKHLYSAGVDVPAVYEVDPEKGMILLEDLGDTTFLKKLQIVSNTELERHLYERAIDALIHFQVFASPLHKPSDLEAYRLAFDLEKLMWEVQFTVEHFYEGYLKRKIKPIDRKILIQDFSKICELLAKEPRVFTHRDYHSRNIMVLPGKIRKKKLRTERFVMIDFQDARMGPVQYDLASLLKDSYYQIDETQVDRLIDYYIARWEAETDEALDRNKFRFVFDHMAIQRNFKAIGSFASFYMLRGNPSYLKFIGNTFENIRRTLLKYPELSNLREVLYHYYYF